MVQVTGMVMETLSMPESEAEELEEIKKLPENSVRASRLRVVLVRYLVVIFECYPSVTMFMFIISCFYKVVKKSPRI